jgi:hypothetical protein
VAQAEQTPAPPAAASTAPASAPVLPSADFIERVVESDEARRQHRVGMICDETIKTERLDDHDKVVQTRTLFYVRGESKDLSYSADVDSTAESTPSPDGKPGKNQDAAKSQHLMAVMNLRKLAPRFTFAYAGTAQLHGHDCVIFSYHPKRNQPYATREEKVINNLQGRYWIDRNTGEIIQIEGSLASPVTVALIASVTRMDFNFHSQNLPNGEVAPLDFSVNLAVKAPFYDFRQRQLTTMENWRNKAH